MSKYQPIQFVNLLLLILLGYFTAYLYLPFSEIFLLLLYGVFIEHFLIYIREKQLHYFSVSAMTTVLGVVLMMVAVHWWIYFVVITAGLLQKHYLRIGGRHLFNPSNFALIVGLLFFYKDAHIVLGQLGDAGWLAGLTVVLAAVVLWVAKRWPIPIIFVVSYILLEYIWIVSTDPVMHFSDLLLRFYSVSFLVFILFMLTDPRTTPANVFGQLLFGAGVALFAVFMDYLYGFRVQHLFLALFAVSVLNGVMKTNYGSRRDILSAGLLILLVMGAIIYIEKQPPYYFEMDR